jgi:hypothetical protein
MDDYNTSVLSEAKNEYSVNLVNILTPLLIQGIQSIFHEACDLCLKNEEENKYLMTFQNFLTRVPKWNPAIIENETKRIIQQSKCNYLEDLITCVHITQLKVLTSIRVATKQKKIELDIPKMSDFVHKIYIKCARKFYSNVYLFEKSVTPLTKQKNLREAEIICKECILDIIRESMPIEQILRAYMDETTEEEIIEEELTKEVPVEEAESMKSTENVNKSNQEASLENSENNEIVKEEIKNAIASVNKIQSSNEQSANENSTPEMENIKLEVQEAISDIEQEVEKQLEQEQQNNIISNTSTLQSSDESLNTDITSNSASAIPTTVKIDTEPTNSIPEPKTSLSFNDVDKVVNYDKHAQPNETPDPKNVHAPKTIERLEEISKIRAEQARLEDEEEEEEDVLTIFDEAPDLQLDELDIEQLDTALM